MSLFVKFVSSRVAQWLGFGKQCFVFDGAEALLDVV
jgi:hypothetical protein